MQEFEGVREPFRPFLLHFPIEVLRLSTSSELGGRSAWRVLPRK
jgi:hypothetical protein